MNRFDDVEYDDLSKSTLRIAKEAIVSVASVMKVNLSDSRQRSEAMTKLEETLLWIKKSIEHDQFKREEKM